MNAVLLYVVLHLLAVLVALLTLDLVRRAAPRVRRTSTSRQDEVTFPTEPCPVCDRVPWQHGVSGCDPHDINGMPRLPHTWHPEDDIPADNPCQCGTPVGGYHHWPCDIEVCPWASTHPDDGEQLLCCGCMA